MEKITPSLRAPLKARSNPDSPNFVIRLVFGLLISTTLLSTSAFAVTKIDNEYMDWSYATGSSGSDPVSTPAEKPDASQSQKQKTVGQTETYTTDSISPVAKQSPVQGSIPGGYMGMTTYEQVESAYNAQQPTPAYGGVYPSAEWAQMQQPTMQPVQTSHAQSVQAPNIQYQYPVQVNYPIKVNYPVQVQPQITVQRPITVTQPVMVQRPVVVTQPITYQQPTMYMTSQPVMMQQSPVYMTNQPVVIPVGGQMPMGQMTPMMQMPMMMGY